MSTFAPHEFVSYPNSPNARPSCVKCGRTADHYLHEIPSAPFCGFTWMEPYQKPGIRAAFGLEQICVLKRGHLGDHTSITKVTKKKMKEQS